MGDFGAHMANQAREAEQANKVLRWLLAESEWKREQLEAEVDTKDLPAGVVWARASDYVQGAVIVVTPLGNRKVVANVRLTDEQAVALHGEMLEAIVGKRVVAE